MTQSVLRQAVFKHFCIGSVGMVLTVSALIIQTASAASFRLTGSMNMARDAHTATLLADGTVLVAGGYNDTKQLASAELYTPNMGTWRLTGSMHFTRAGHTATRLPDGKVLVAGGYDGTNILSSAELYDPATGLWFTTGSMSTPRSTHTATLLPGDKVLVAGGFDDAGVTLTSAELYDPSTGNWLDTDPMNNARYEHTATLLTNGLVLVAGGQDYWEISSAELYDPISGKWALAGALIKGRVMHTTTLLPNGSVLAAGGGVGAFLPYEYVSLSTAELFDVESGMWSATGSMVSQDGILGPIGHFEHTATLLPNGQVLLAGGEFGWEDFFDVASVTLRTSELYDPGDGIWTATANLIEPRQQHTATLLADGEVLVAGGHSGDIDQALASAERYGVTPTPTILLNPKRLTDGSFQFSFTNAPGAVLTVIASTNPALPVNGWTALGGATEVAPGEFQFTAADTTNYLQRFYRLWSP